MKAAGEWSSPGQTALSSVHTFPANFLGASKSPPCSFTPGTAGNAGGATGASPNPKNGTRSAGTLPGEGGAGGAGNETEPVISSGELGREEGGGGGRRGRDTGLSEKCEDNNAI